MEYDVIIWFDDKNCTVMTAEDKASFIQECAMVAHKYGFDYFMCSNPTRLKRYFEKINFEDEVNNANN